MNRYLILASLLVASSSCSKEVVELSEPTIGPNMGKMVTLTASLADADVETRVSTNTDSEDKWTFAWDDKDVISAWHDKITDQPLKFEMSKFDDKNSAFTGETGLGEKHRFIYPFEEAIFTSNGYYTIDVSEQTTGKELSKTYLINDAPIATSDIQDGVVSSLSMKHLGAIMVVDVYLENPIADKTYRLKGVKYSSADNAINSSAVIDMEEVDFEKIYNSVTAGTITAEMDVEFMTATDDPEFLQAITKLNMLPSTVEPNQTATIELMIDVYDNDKNDLLNTLTLPVTITNTSGGNLEFARATHNFTYLTVDGSYEAKITGTKINDWEVVESGDLPTSKN